MFYVYLLISHKDKKWYTGFTPDLKERILKHNNGLVFSTKHRIPFKLVYCEICLNEKDARARERYLKTGMGKRFLKNRLKYFLSENDF